MPQQVSFSGVNNFSAGLVTEFTGLNFPQNACIDCKNVSFSNTTEDGLSGLVTRRPGFGIEDSATFTTLPSGFDFSTDVIKTFVWKNPGLQNTTEAFLCVQVGSRIDFFLVQKQLSISGNKKSFSVDLNSFAVSGSPSVSTELASFAEGNGYLFVAHPYCDPFYISYDATTDTITETVITIKIRDFQGVDDGLDFTTRPTSLSNEHKYNLLNQGWTDKRITDTYTASGTATQYPSNADVWWHYKDASENFQPSYLFDDKYKNINQAAAKGYFILDAFNKDRNTASGLTGLPTTSSGYLRPNAVAFFSGRVFYSSPHVEGYSGRIYFSPVIEDPRQAGDCYQRNDPTSEDFPDLLASDGGEIIVGNTGKIFDFSVFQEKLIIRSQNGIWVLGGSQGSGFTATDYSLSKVSGVSSINNQSLVDVNGTPMWWGVDGIYAVSSDQLGAIKTVSLTDSTIRSLYVGIPTDKRVSSKGSFDTVKGDVVWVYDNDDNTGKNVLIYNVLKRSFSPWEVKDSNKYTIGDVFSFSGDHTVPSKVNVTDNNEEQIIDSLNNNVVINEDSITKALTFTKFVCLNKQDSTYTFGEFKTEKEEFFDWPTDSRNSYKSYFSTGYKVDPASRNFQSTYVTIYSKAGGDYSCKLSANWDFSTLPPITKQEVYNWGASDQSSYVKRRLKIPGRGTSVVFKFEGVEDKNFKIVGWTTRDLINADIG